MHCLYLPAYLPLPLLADVFSLRQSGAAKVGA